MALATENGMGIYLLGSRGPLAGYLPDPGFYLQNDIYLYNADTGRNRSFPTGGQVLANVESNAQIDLLSGLAVLAGDYLGGNLAIGAVVPYGHSQVDAGVRIDPVSFNAVDFNVSDSTTAVGDPLLTASMGWHSGNWHWTTSTLINVPIGEYREGKIANIALNRWAADLSAAITWLYIDTGTELSLATGYTFNGTNEDTDYTSGDELHIEWSATQFLSTNFSLGLVGYHYEQVSSDSGDGATLGAYKGKVTAIGATIGYTLQVSDTPITTRLKVFEEFDTENRMEGTAAYLTFSFPVQVN